MQCVCVCVCVCDPFKNWNHLIHCPEIRDELSLDDNQAPFIIYYIYYIKVMCRTRRIMEWDDTDVTHFRVMKRYMIIKLENLSNR